ncbi:TetR/AcrR family transcriptional regulator [Siminovitchia fortis]|uniref:TetR/AcrR family transcriptional regulator n=1 Tax=Siminovitchia fortis TaxID=254758 RepID=A0A443IZG1_9BACI|nr:TetR/AcrR family transcriptional regulator [Siminovitchia fortis]RWR13509.1 TetR/AcrR family transcriptional regulator [Siminovitchia fortis]WHY81750.1 TetR/AcrR family transcriptional regulator [Siminovitchia fortis]
MKDRIMQAFVDEVKDKGIKFTMDDLAGRLGISKRTLYEHFSSKVEILDAIIDLTITEFDEKTEAIIQDSSLTLLEKIKEAIMVVPKYDEFYDLQILEQMKRYYPKQWEKMNNSLYEWEALKKLLEQGIEEGLIKDQNVELLMRLVIDATNLTLDRRFIWENRITVQEAMNGIVNVLLFGMVEENAEP